MEKMQLSLFCLDFLVNFKMGANEQDSVRSSSGSVKDLPKQFRKTPPLMFSDAKKGVSYFLSTHVEANNRIMFNIVSITFTCLNLIGTRKLDFDPIF